MRKVVDPEAAETGGTIVLNRNLEQHSLRKERGTGEEAAEGRVVPETAAGPSDRCLHRGRSRLRRRHRLGRRDNATDVGSCSTEGKDFKIVHEGLPFRS